MKQEANKTAAHQLLDREEIRDVLAETFYRNPSNTEASKPKRKAKKKKKPDHYEVICISLYKEDLARLDSKVKQLKSAGHRKMSRSALIRFALDTVDLDQLPRGY